jgi:hypothetical protein
MDAERCGEDLSGVADGLDVVAVRVADECAIVPVVVFGPLARLVQHSDRVTA